TPDIPGIDHTKVVSYVDVLAGNAAVGRRVAVIGAGGIGFDVSEFLTHAPLESAEPNGVQANGHAPAIQVPDPLPSAAELEAFLSEWGVTDPQDARGGLAPTGPQPELPQREIYLLQRSQGKIGAGLGKTTGWIHRSSLKMRHVRMMGGLTYELIDDQGLHVQSGDKTEVLEVDTVVICAGQEPRRDLHSDLVAAGVDTHLIGGADVAAELDAKRAIRQGTELAAVL
ncbi:MAG: FAD-dependent oxidoreductase, partial [Pseudomonadota bacterium]